MTKLLPIKQLRNERSHFDIWNIIGTNILRVCSSDSSRGRKTVNIWSYPQETGIPFKAGVEKERWRAARQQTFETADEAYEYIRRVTNQLRRDFNDRTSHLNKEWEGIE